MASDEPHADFHLLKSEFGSCWADELKEALRSSADVHSDDANIFSRDIISTDWFTFLYAYAYAPAY